MKNTLLRRARLQKGWSQRQLADFAEIGIATVARAERGRPLRIDNVRRICTCLDKTPEQLGLLPLEDPRESMKTFYRKREGAKEDASASPVRFTPEQVVSLFRLLASGDITMAHFDPERREALLQLLSTGSMLTIVPQALADPDPEPWERLSSSLAKPSNLDAATFKHFESLTATCWEFSNSGQLQLAEQVLTSFLPGFLQLAPAHAQAASLASEGLTLQSILVAHRLQLAEKVKLCQRAIVYAKQASDYPILIAALRELVAAFRYTQQYDNMLKTSQEMLFYSQYVSPQLQTRAYIMAAEALSRNGRIKEAEFYIQLAYETFHSEHDLVVDANPNIFPMGMYEGLAYLSQGKGDKAFSTFGGQLFEGRVTGYQSTSALPERIRLEITNHQGQAAILSNNLEEYARCFEEGVTGALALKSQKRFHEAVTIFRQEVPAKWRDEPLIKDLAERFQLVG